MKSTRKLFGAAMLLCLAPGLAQETQETQAGAAAETEKEQRAEMRREVGEAVEAIRGYSVERRNEALAVARRAMDDADRQAERLQARLDAGRDRMDAAARERSQQAMAELRQRRTKLAEWADGMQHASAAAWSEARQGFVDGYHDVAEALERARSRLESDAPRRPADDGAEQEEEEAERKQG